MPTSEDVNMVAQSLTNFANLVYQNTKFNLEYCKSKSNNVLEYCRNMNKFKLLISFTFAWAYLSMCGTKLFTAILRMLLFLPDKYLSPFVFKQPCNTDGKKIKIIHVESDKEVLTNKLKLFVQCYWKSANNESAFENNGFNVREFGKMVGASIFYCTYLLSDNDDKVSPEDFWNSVNQFIIKSDDGIHYHKISKNNMQSNKVFLGHIDFDRRVNHDS
jgi:hypothetical protein